LARITILLFFLICLQVHAAPDGTDLLRACETSVSNGFRNIEGQICEYYVIPCNCDVDPVVPGHICLPDHISTKKLAVEVIDGLRNSPELQQQYAGTAAGIILTQRYPCTHE